MIYFKRDTALPPFVPLPRFMIASEYSMNAKMLYSLLLGRTQLSQKSGWVSEDGNVYVVYPIKQLAEDLNRSEKTVKNALNELENAGLLSRVRQGWNRANHIYLKIPDVVQLSTHPEGSFYPMDGEDFTHCRGQNLPPNNTNQDKKESSHNDKGEITRRRFGDYQNVFLSDHQLAELQAAYPGKWEEYINRLSAYMASSGRHYANHYATIRKWLDEDGKAKPGKSYDYDTIYDEGECL